MKMTDKARILVADDDPSVRRLLTLRLQAAGYETRAATDGREALGMISGFRPQLVLTDLRMPGLDGMALFAAIRQRHANLPVIILTAHGTIPDAVEATRKGVFGYLTKPFDSQSLLEWVAKALRFSGEEPRSASGSTVERRWRDDIITRNADMESLLRQAGMAAVGETPIMIQGAIGTGKNLLARALHRASHRDRQPLVEVNAAVIPEALLEAEFFGQGAHAFKTARRPRAGLFRRANGGTLFIDDVDALPQGFQLKLLHALRAEAVQPLGEERPAPVDVRLITAMRNERTAGAIKGRLREDLYYALGVVPLVLPPLKARKEDVPLLAAQFLAAAARRAGKMVNGFSPGAMERLLAAPWPGNVRELRGVIERAVALADTPLIPEDLVTRALSGQSNDELASLSAARDEFERDYLVQLLRIAQGNVSHAARLAQRNRTEFYKLLHRHHLDPKSFRKAVQ